MPKISKVGGFRAQAALEKKQQQTRPVTKHEVTTEDVNINNGTSTEAALSRGQKRRLAKREQYLKRENMILSSLRLSHQAEEQRLDGFRALWNTLPSADTTNSSIEQDVSTSRNETIVLRHNKQKRNIAATEIIHYNLVLQHPSFQSNPFGSMQEHLRNTLAAAAPNDHGRQHKGDAFKNESNKKRKTEELTVKSKAKRQHEPKNSKRKKNHITNKNRQPLERHSTKKLL